MQLASVSELTEKDVLMQSNSFFIISDEQSLAYIGGLHVTYSDDVMHGGFKFTNPQAESSCGCGASFTPKAVVPVDGTGDTPAAAYSAST